MILPSEPSVPITLTVNGEPVSAHVSPRTSVVDFLRADLGLTGSHIGCEHGSCGACTLRVDDRIVRGCLLLAVQASGSVVETIEGLSNTGEIADLQALFIARNAFQCGFCTSGMLMTGAELMATRPGATRAEIREFIAGNYCRCTGYQAIVDALECALTVRRESGTV